MFIIIIIGCQLSQKYIHLLVKDLIKLFVIDGSRK
jgi:hypothetical protein